MHTFRRTFPRLIVLLLSLTSVAWAAGRPAIRPVKNLNLEAARTIKPILSPPVLKGKSVDIARDMAQRIPYAYINGVTGLEVFIDRGPEFRWWAKGHFLENTSSNQTLKFRWNTDAKNVASAQWQITVFRYAPGLDNWEHPVGLVQKGNTAIVPAKGSYAEFSIDFSKFAPQPKTQGAPSATFVKPAVKLAPGVRPNLSTSKNVAVGAASPSAANRPVPSKPSPKPAAANKPAVRPGEAFSKIVYYIRVVPLDKSGNCIAAPSEPVEITYGKPDPPSITLYPGATGPGSGQPDKSKLPKLNHPTVTLVKYHPINEQWTNAMYQFVVIKDWPPGMVAWHVGQELDFTPHQEDKSWWEELGDFLSDVADFVADAVNWVADAYQAIKDFAIDSVMVFLPEELRGPLTMGLDIGLACMGLPPSIPSFSELTSMGKDYLVRYCAESAGIPADLAGQAVDGFISAAQSTSNGGGGNPAVWMKPNPRAYYRPAYVELEVSNPTSEWTRRVALATTADPTNDAEAKQYGERLFTSEYLTIPAMAPGDSFKVPMYLTEYMLLRQFDHDPFAGKQRFWLRYHVGGMSMRVYTIAFLPKGENPAKYQNASQDQVTVTMEKARQEYP